MSSKPIVRVQFTNEEEYWTLVKVAAQHDQKMPDFLRNCAILVTNDFFARQDAALAAQQENNNEESAPENNDSDETSTPIGEESPQQETPADA